MQTVNNGRYAPDLGILEQEHIDRLVTMHTSIASGDVWCKYQISPALSQGARSLTEEKEEKSKKAYEKNLLQRKHEGVYKLRRHCFSYR